MVWTKKHAEARRQKEQNDPKYREKRRKQGQAKDKAARKRYMQEYARQNPEKFKRTPEQQAKVNERRRQKYAENEAHREKTRQQVKEWQQANPRARKRQRIKKYGLTLDQFDALMESANHQCQICGYSDTISRKFFPVIDHCHDTEKVRGVLCMNCNQGIGKFQDSPERLEAAITYLRNSRSS